MCDSLRDSCRPIAYISLHKYIGHNELIDGARINNWSNQHTHVLPFSPAVELKVSVAERIMKCFPFKGEVNGRRLKMLGTVHEKVARSPGRSRIQGEM